MKFILFFVSYHILFKQTHFSHPVSQTVPLEDCVWLSTPVISILSSKNKLLDFFEAVLRKGLKLSFSLSLFLSFFSLSLFLLSFSLSLFLSFSLSLFLSFSLSSLFLSFSLPFLTLLSSQKLKQPLLWDYFFEDKTSSLKYYLFLCLLLGKNI